MVRDPLRVMNLALVFSCLTATLACGLDVTRRPVGTIDDIVNFGQRDDTNVLFILVDTLRADHLEAYGYERGTSPRLAELAEGGVLFNRHVSQSSWTKCSMASLWTGLYPARSGVVRASHVIPDEARLPAEIFRDGGFRTAGIWRNSWIAPNFGFSQGFEMYTKPVPGQSLLPKRQEAPNMLLSGSDADVIRSAFGFLRAHGHERWFLYLHLMDVHQYVYSPEEAVFGISYLDVYDNSILWTDTLIGHFLDELEARGLRERTLVVFASDHGEAFGEHGVEGHARNVYGEVTETPWLISFPFELPEGIVVDSRTANVDLWPTILDLMKLEELDDPDGRSRVPDILAAARGDDPLPSDPIFSYLDFNWGHEKAPRNPLVAINKDNLRLFRRAIEPDNLELFDKSVDPVEWKNLAATHPEITAELSQLVVEHLDGPPPPWGEDVPSIDLDEMQLNQLRALGYGVR